MGQSLYMGVADENNFWLLLTGFAHETIVLKTQNTRYLFITYIYNKCRCLIGVDMTFII